MTIRLSFVHLGIFIGLVVAASLGAVVALALARGDDPDTSTTTLAEPTSTEVLAATETPPPSPTSSPSPTPTVTPVPCNDVDAAEKVRASVVRIDLIDGTATGTIVTDTGLALTNEHVFRFVEAASITLPSGRVVQGTVLAKSFEKDLALFRLDAAGLTAANWAPVDSARPGSRLLAWGYALGISGEPTLTTGTYSGQRDLESVTFIQTDTPLNFGNSGGPLFNDCGEVVGIVSRGFSNAQGLNFAVSAADAQDFVAQHRDSRPGLLAQSPEDTVRLYYQAIDQGRFDIAYDQFSAKLKSPASSEQFAAGFTTTRGVDIEFLQREPGLDNVVRVSIVVTDFLHGQFVITRFSGTWSLVQEFGQWKLDSANIVQGP